MGLNPGEGARAELVGLPAAVADRFGVEIEPDAARFWEGCWTYQGTAPLMCSDCPTNLEIFRRPFRAYGRDLKYWGIVCLECKTASGIDEYDGSTQRALRAWDRGDVATLESILARPAPPSRDRAHTLHSSGYQSELDRIMGCDTGMTGPPARDPGAGNTTPEHTTASLLSRDPRWSREGDSEIRCPVDAGTLEVWTRPYERAERFFPRFRMRCSACSREFGMAELDRERRLGIQRWYAGRRPSGGAAVRAPVVLAGDELVSVWFAEPVEGRDPIDGQMQIANRHRVSALWAPTRDGDTVFVDANGEVVGRWPSELIVRVEWPDDGPGGISSLGTGTREWMEKVKQRHPRAYQRWSEEEDSALANEFEGNVPIAEMASIHKRRVGGIMARLVKIDLVGPQETRADVERRRGLNP